MSPASYAVLKNLNEPFYFFLQVKIDKPSPTLLLSLLVCLIKSGVRAGCFFCCFVFPGLVANGEFYVVSDIVCCASHKTAHSQGLKDSGINVREMPLLWQV